MTDQYLLQTSYHTKAPHTKPFFRALGYSVTRGKPFTVHSLSLPRMTRIRRKPGWYAATAPSRRWAQVGAPQ